MNAPKARSRETAQAFVTCMEGRFQMLRIPDPGRGLVRCLGLAAAAILLLSAATGERAEALSLANPGAVPAAKYVSDGWTTEVRGGHGGGGHGGGFHGGGGGGFRGGGAAFHASGIRSGGAVFHGGGYRSGAAVFRGGGYRSGHVFRGGGYRYSGIRYGGYRYGGHRFAHRHHHFHRRFFYGPSYYDDYPYYYHHYRRCRVIWTYYGPRRVCHFRHWRHHRYW
jgi:hypothetical protein